MLGDKQIFEHGHPSEKADVLEGAGDARGSRDLEASHALQKENRAPSGCGPLFSSGGDAGQNFKRRAAPMSERNAALGRLIKPRDAVEDRGLARAVRANDRGDVATLRREREPVHGDESAKAHGELLHAEDLVLFRSRAPAHQPCPSLARLAEMPRASRRRADGVRSAMSPRCRQIMTSTIASPKISMR